MPLPIEHDLPRIYPIQCYTYTIEGEIAILHKEPWTAMSRYEDGRDVAAGISRMNQRFYS